MASQDLSSTGLEGCLPASGSKSFDLWSNLLTLGRVEASFTLLSLTQSFLRLILGLSFTPDISMLYEE